MTITHANKWIDGVTADDSVPDVAPRSLRARFAAVAHYLPLAAEHAEEDVEHVHQLRVASRRATAALRLYEPWLPHRRCAWTRKQIKRVRRAANEARDCDVLLVRLEGRPSDRDARRWRDEVRRERDEAQQAILAVHERLGREQRFTRQTDKLLERVGRRGTKAGPAPKFGDWARQRLRPVVEEFFAAVPSDPADEAALHRFRIRGKELRYTMELLAGAFPDSLRTELYPAVEAIQDRLGEINDLATAAARLRQKSKAAAKPAGKRAWERLLAGERELLDQARASFWNSGAARELERLGQGFRRLLDDPHPGVAAPPPPPAVTPATLRGRSPEPARPASGSPCPVNGAGRARSEPGIKAQIVGELGETALLLPALVNEALAANDRAKYRMTLLQSAREHADRPGAAVADLRSERVACGIPDDELDAAVQRSRKEDGDKYIIPAVRRLHDGLVEDVRRMLAPLRAQDGADAVNRPLAATGYENRLQSLLAEAPSLANNSVPGAYITRVNSGLRGAGDSVHLLVMDLHKELNRLQQQLATETIDGAHVYSIEAEDRPLIAALMKGVNQTRALKFDHPGLGTTATRSGGRLVIQNDIGLTDAHVLVVHVEDRRVTLTYTDIHLERLVFFQNLFDRFSVCWADTVSKRASGLEEDLYHLSVGTYAASDRAALSAYLTFLGSRLVFLIDWNRARKRLRKFAPRRVCLDVLRWAADQDLGHRGFLALGGEQLIFEALQAAGRLPLPPGEQLSDFLGRERTAEFLKFTLQTASEGLRAGQSEFLIRDEISAELRRYIDTVHQGLLEVAAEHASLIVELATAARDLLVGAAAAPDRGLIERVVQRALRWEHRADELVNRCRAARPDDESRPVRDLLVTADDAADDLEEAVFRLSLLLGATAGVPPAPLSELAGLLVQGAQEYLKAVENARQLHRGSLREQVDDFLRAVDQTLTVEHQTDDAHRRSQAALLSFPGDFKQWHLFGGVADKFEEAADALLRSALALRDYILSEVLRR